jgi:hypothetical protein
MATVTLSRHECTRDLLPKVCAECGAPAAGTVGMNFSWAPRMPVRMPFCAHHQRRRRLYAVRFTVLFLATVASMGLSYYFVALSPASINPVLAACTLGVSMVLFWLWIVLVIVVSHRDIEATHITDRSLTLDRVHEAFVAAVAEARDRGDPDAHRRFGDLRDDFDDVEDHS